MKAVLPGLLAVFLLAGCITQSDNKTPRTPAMYVERDPSPDGRRWVPLFMSGSSKGFLIEYAPSEDLSSPWSELVIHQTIYTKQSAQQFAESWAEQRRALDPHISIESSINSDGSITLTYFSLIVHEMGTRRFIRAEDGIYMICYQVRPDLRDDDIYAAWEGAIIAATLEDNTTNGEMIEITGIVPK